MRNLRGAVAQSFGRDGESELRRYLPVAGHSIAALLMLIVASASARPQTIRIPFSVRDHLIVVRARVGDTETEFVLDSGAECSLLDGTLFYETNNLPDDARTISYSGVLGGRDATAILVSLPVRIGGQTTESTSILLAPTDIRAGSAHIRGILGAPFLSQFKRIEIDYKDRIVELEK
jgi:hypothetical protein